MKNAKSVIVLDLDDVLVDWWGNVFKLFGQNFSEFKKLGDGEGGAVQPFERKIEKYLSLATGREITPEILKDVIDRAPDFWYSMEPLPEAREFVQDLCEFGPVILVTSISNFSADTARQKLLWIENHLWDVIPTEYRIITNCRHYLAGPRRILIDDAETNIKAFKEIGGQGVLVPKVWNSRFAFSDDYGDVIEEVGEIVGDLQSAASAPSATVEAPAPGV